MVVASNRSVFNVYNVFIIKHFSNF